VIVQHVDGLTVLLREYHDLEFLSRWGRVFRVLDQQDSGNLCFGVEGSDGRVFIKYAGAPTARFEGRPADAVARSRRAAEVYRALVHPALVRLREAVDVGQGYAMVFDWTDAVPVGRQYEQSHVVREFSLSQRAAAVQQIYDFHVHAVERGWVAVDLYDGSVLVELATGRVILCDLDVYERAPTTNQMGRMWGSTRFMSPEEYQLGSVIDEVTNVFALGAMAHTFLGDDASKARSAWVGSDEQYRVAARALQPRRADRWPSVAELSAAWRAASSGFKPE
jgi:serine/threonine protein kinase